MVSTETIRETTVITTGALLRGGDCLQLATAEAIDRRSITGFYAKPTNYTSVGVSPDYNAMQIRHFNDVNKPCKMCPSTPDYEMRMAEVVCVQAI